MSVQTTMETGKVKFFNETKGFGFIINDETGDEIFFHATQVKNSRPLRQNDNVKFEIGDGKRGPAAINVSAI